MKTLISKITLGACLIASFSFFNANAACDNPAYIEGADRNYAKDDIISRNGVDYKVIWDTWCNSSLQDWAYAPGTGSIWQNAWSLENDPCIDTGGGGGGGATCSDGIQNQDETGVDCGGATCSPCGGGGGETCSDGIQNQDETGVDCGGASCSPCGSTGGGGGNGQTCTVTTDDGLAQATYYTLLETGASSVVTCSFDAVNDIKGTFYGALETATLHGPGGSTPAVYCGMCVNMVGPGGTHIVQITDECPDCHEHNSGHTDIDLSTPAFAAVVGPQSIGRADITWSEVACPWTSPLQVIVQGSNEWFAKVIIANHVNRIAKVEVMFGGSWVAMTRKVDNSWEKGSINGASKDFRITDIYGEEITVSGISFSANPTNSKNYATGSTTNFTACGLSTSNTELNTLDYVAVYPNPANDFISIEGLDDVQSLQIINLNGQVIISETLGGNTSKAGVDIANLPSGIYVVKLTGNTKSGTATFVKR